MLVSPDDGGLDRDGPVDLVASAELHTRDGRKSALLLWDVPTRRLRQIFSSARRMMSSEISPDGRLAAIGHIDGSVHIRETATGKVTAALTGRHGPAMSMAFSGDGRTLAIRSHDGTIQLWDVSAERIRHTLTGTPHEFLSMALSLDGRILATGSPGDVPLRLWDVASGSLRDTLGRHRDVESRQTSRGVRRVRPRTGPAFQPIRLRRGRRGGLRPHRVAILVHDRVTLLDNAGPMVVWREANRFGADHCRRLGERRRPGEVLPRHGLLDRRPRIHH
ncbi:WD40 repeat domain-containing protein [Streptomyces sp. NPDC055025]